MKIFINGDFYDTEAITYISKISENKRTIQEFRFRILLSGSWFSFKNDTNYVITDLQKKYVGTLKKDPNEKSSLYELHDYIMYLKCNNDNRYARINK